MAIVDKTHSLTIEDAFGKVAEGGSGGDTIVETIGHTVPVKMTVDASTLDSDVPAVLCEDWLAFNDGVVIDAQRDFSVRRMPFMIGTTLIADGVKDVESYSTPFILFTDIDQSTREKVILGNDHGQKVLVMLFPNMETADSTHLENIVVKLLYYVTSYDVEHPIIELEVPSIEIVRLSERGTIARYLLSYGA